MAIVCDRMFTFISFQMVSYTSSATFCSSFGVDQHVEILKYPIRSAASPKKSP